MKKARIHLVAGARPNFMKIGPVYHELVDSDWADPAIVHTGQHFSSEMSDVFFRDLRLPPPHFHLNAKGTTHAQQTAAILTAYEDLCQIDRPTWTIVVGDVNSTLAACITAKKLHIPVAHLEAGLRSGDRSMPEEINRLVVDSIADLLWTPSEDANANLLREGIEPGRIDLVGNVMIDAFCLMQDVIRDYNAPGRHNLRRRGYAVVTLHRPSNVDNEGSLRCAVNEISTLAQHMPIVFPVHPRTKTRLETFGLWKTLEKSKVKLLPPLSYVEFMSFVEGSGVVITDSGGVQEETSYLGIPCLTVRTSTERPITVSLGSNRLISLDQIAHNARHFLATENPSHNKIPLWDGKTASRIVASLETRTNNPIQP